MNFFEDLKMVYKKAILKTIKSIKTNIGFLTLPLIYSGVIYGINYLNPLRFLNIGIFGGFIMALVYAAVLSSYFSMISDVVFYNRINLKYLQSSFTKYFSNIYSVFFITMIARILINNLTYSIVTLIGVAYFILFNSIQEIIYIRGEQYTDIFTTAIDFMKENFLVWNIPNLIYILLGYLIYSTNIFYSIFNLDVLEFSLNQIILTSEKMPLMIGFHLITGIFVIFRGHLFTILNNSSRRKRAYMGDLNDY